MTCYLSSLYGRNRAQGKLTVDLHSSIAEPDADEWDNIVNGRNIFLSRRFLTALERSGTPVCHAVFRQGTRPVGVASFQVAEFTGKGLASYIDFQCPIARRIAGPIQRIHTPKSFPMVVCGSPFVSGEHGYSFLDETDGDIAAAALSSAAKAAKAHFDKQTAAPSSGILFKEFHSSSRDLVRGLADCRFAELATDPAMVLFIDPAWKSFEDYLASLSSKYRINANRAYLKSKELIVKELDADDIAVNREQILALYHLVVDRAGTRLGGLSVDMLIELSLHLKGELIVQGYFFKNRLLGFLMGFVNSDSLEAGFVGFDQGFNREHSIYPRMLYDYLKIAMSRGLKQVNYGRTASEIKSTLGAVPLEMSCCLTLDKKFLNTVLPLFVGAIKPLPFAQRKPFKKEWYELKELMVSRNLSAGFSVQGKDTVF
jgi:predicted N-acyltransferase